MEETNNKCYFYIDPVKRTVTIGRKIIEGLGYPKRIRILINPDTMQLAIQPCNSKETRWFKVPKDLFSGGHTFRITSTSLVNLIFEKLDWDVRFRYRAYGKILPNELTCFMDLHDAVQRPIDEFDDEER